MRLHPLPSQKSHNKLLQKLEQVDSLPAIPRIAQKILSLKTHTDEGESALIELIKNDPLILARIIGLANSPLFGTGRKILTLPDARALLGINRIKMIALNFAMQSSMVKDQAGLLNIQSLWQHSLAVAMAMDILANCMPSDDRPSDDEVHLVGLLHDMGYLVLKYLDAKLSDRLHARIADETSISIQEIEMEVLDGLGHGELGSILARHWKLPESIIDTLKYHNAPGDEMGTGVTQMVTMIRVAEMLLPAFIVAEHVQRDITREDWQSLGIDPARENEIKANIQKLTEKLGDTQA